MQNVISLWSWALWVFSGIIVICIIFLCIVKISVTLEARPKNRERLLLTCSKGSLVVDSSDEGGNKYLIEFDDEIAVLIKDRNYLVLRVTRRSLETMSHSAQKKED